MYYLTQSLVTARKICMTIGALLFLLLGAHTVMSAGSPQAAHQMHDVQPEVRQSLVVAH